MQKQLLQVHLMQELKEGTTETRINKMFCALVQYKARELTNDYSDTICTLHLNPYF